ncbi:MAG: phosphoglucosamine mutase [Dethiobacteria bacterium]
MGKLFGTDGIRGVANQELTPELAFKMGRIVAFLLGSEGPPPHTRRRFFLLGRDTRLSGSMLEGALTAGITSTGMDVQLLGVLSTPAVAYLSARLGAAGAVMISASHNPVGDNGLKFFNGQGFKLRSEQEKEAEKLYFQEEDPSPRPTGMDIGRSWHAEEALEDYLSFMKKNAPPLQDLRIVLDCANGSLAGIAPSFFRELGAEVFPYNSIPDGEKINVNCGSTNPSLLQEAVREKRAHLGLAFDGDGDRLIAVDEKGEVVDGDAIMAVCASYLKEKNRLRGNKIVATVLSNGGLDLAGAEKGFAVLRTKVGDRYVFEEMQRGGYVLGGEQSGHIIFGDLLPTGDGLLTSLQLLRVMVEKSAPLSSLAAIMIRLPQLQVNCPVENKSGWETNPRINASIKQVGEKLGNKGRVLVRASGTEPLIRIMLEGQNDTLLQELSQVLAKVIKQEMGALS